MSVNLDLGSDALNSAAWVLLDELGNYSEVEPILFNNLKECLKAAIEEYLKEALQLERS